jgi:hypothetical protein
MRLSFPITFPLACALLAAALPSIATAQTASTQAVVRIENYALVLTKQNDMDFGSITPSLTNDGYVVLQADGVTSPAGVAAYNPAGANPALYSVTGVPSAQVAITLPGTVSLSNGAESLLIGDFTAENGTLQQLGTDGTLGFRVGATVFVQALQRPGVYTGSFDVTLLYN